ncbi:retrovirus-related pol polyprotein from transposon TNT 1-94 [Tanacetum coccineum]
MLRHVSLEGRPIVVLSLRGELLGANPIPYCLARGHAVWHRAYNLARVVQFGTIMQFSMIMQFCTSLRAIYHKKRTDTGAEGTTEDKKQKINKSKSWKMGEIKVRRLTWELETLMTHRLCCVENMVEDRIMDSGALFHATYCKEELERFKLCSDKVHSRPIRLISVGQLDEEGCHVGFGDQQWKVTKGSLVVARRNKRGSIYMVEVYPEGIGAIIKGSGSADVWFGEAEEDFLPNVSKDKETAETTTGVAVERDCDAEMVLETPLQFGVAERLSRTFRAESAGFMQRLQRCYGQIHGSYEMRYSFRDTKSHQVIRSRDIIFVDSIYRAKYATDSSSLTNPIQKSQVVLVDISENLAENDSIVAEHGLSSEITQSPGESLDTSGGSENSGSFEDSGRSDEEYSKDGASFEEGGSKNPQVQRSTRESRAPVRYSPSANYLLLTENGEPDSYSEALSSKESVQWKKAIIEEMVSLKMNEACSLVRLPAGMKASQRLWMFKVKEEHNSSEKASTWQFPLVFEMKDRCYEKQVLGYVLTVGVTIVEWESRLQKSITMLSVNYRKDTKSLIHLVKNLKVCSWAKLVRILISEGSLSLLKILGTKCLAEMFTRLVMKEKLKFYAASTSL